MKSTEILHFIRESNAIEGIYRAPTVLELNATACFLELPALTVNDVCDLVFIYQPEAVLRDRIGLDVRVGSYVAPPGGPEIRTDLALLLDTVSRAPKDPHKAHLLYEMLHPFTDGNGRSGRAIWLWQMGGTSLGFLHAFYYQTLEAYQRS